MYLTEIISRTKFNNVYTWNRLFFYEELWSTIKNICESKRHLIKYLNVMYLIKI